MKRRLIGTIVLSAFLVVGGLWVGGRLAEWGPFRGSLWTTGTRTVSAQHYESADAPYEHRGPSHCGQQDDTFISYLRGAYVNRSYESSGSDLIVFDADATLPDDAVYTRWHRGERQLWLSGSERTGADAHYSGIYIVTPDHVERWPFYPFGCA